MFTIIAKQLVRNFRKDRIHMLLNLAGLSFGLTASLLVLLYVQQVLGFDKFHVNKDRIYRFGVSMTIGSSPTSTQEGCSPGTGPILKEAITGIEEYARTLTMGTVNVKIGEDAYSESSLSWADNSIFKVFTFPLLTGDPATALERKNTMVITSELATKYFGTTDVIGRMVKIENTGDFEITGVLKDIPENSFLSFSGFLSLVTINSRNPGDYQITDLFSNMGSRLYFLFSEGYTADSFNKAFKTWYDENMASVDMLNFVAVVEPYKDAYLNSVISASFSQGNRMVLTGFISIGLLLLLLACVNYINLTTSRAEERAKEIGVRKISGAGESNLRRQLLIESVIMTFVSMLLALVITEFVLNFTRVNDLIGIELSLNPFKNNLLLVSILIIPVIVGLLAGFYPAFLMSKMAPVTVMKAARGGTMGKSYLRRSLILFQFTVSVGALILSLLMSNQIKRIINIDPGFDKKNLIYITCSNQSVRGEFRAYREKISSYHGIISTSLSDRSPGYGFTGAAMNWETEDGQMDVFPAVFISTDNEYFKTLGIELIEGSGFFKPRQASDTVLYFMVSETFVRSMGWTEAVGKRNERGQTIAVVNDFSYGPLIYPLRPMFITQYREDRIPGILNVRISEGDAEKTVEYLRMTWKESLPDVPFVFVYAEDLINDLYSSLRNQSLITIYLSLTCLLISCLGLISYSSYIAYRKKKDFVLRKVYGATSGRIFREFAVVIIRIMFISSVPANILAWIAYREWSSSFAYKPPVNVWVFIGTTLGMLILAIAVTAYHVASAARTNPAENLANE